MIVLVGESASGKSSIEKKLVSKYGYTKVISYTTRKPRDGEKHGVDYFFVSEDEFNSLSLHGIFAETTVYNGWLYGAPKNQCTENSVLVANPYGLRQIRKNEELNVVSFYISVPRRDRLIKILQRGDNIEESMRRSTHDEGQFNGIEDEVDFIVKNNDYEVSVEELASHIHSNYKFELKYNEHFHKREEIVNSKKTIYVDFDGTIVNSIKAIVDLYNYDFQHYPWFEKIKWQDVETWGFEELRGITPDDASNYFQQQRFFDKLEFMPYAKETLEELSKEFDIKIVSFGYAANLKAKAIWISKNIPYAEFIPLNFDDYEDKSHIDMRNSIFIDDNNKYLSTSNAGMKICFGAEYPWNADYREDEENGNFLCLDWDEVRSLLI